MWASGAQSSLGLWFHPLEGDPDPESMCLAALLGRCSQVCVSSVLTVGSVRCCTCPLLASLLPRLSLHPRSQLPSFPSFSLSPVLRESCRL